MNIQEVLIRKRGAIHVELNSRPRAGNPQDPRTMAFQAEIMRLGYILDADAMRQVSMLGNNLLGELYTEVIGVLRKLTGDDKTWEPFYPNFPYALTPEIFCNIS